jgi:DNA-binding response OmpR family regulator
MLHVLLVQDETTVIDTMQLTLQAYCHASVTMSNTGSAAFSEMNRLWFDAAVIDAVLPDISGFDVAARAIELHIPALLTSGHPDVLALCRHYSLPVLEKPFLPTLLAERTIQLIRQAEKNAAALAATFAGLRETNDDLRWVMSEARRLINESVASREGSARVKYNAIGGTSPLRVTPEEK